MTEEQINTESSDDNAIAQLRDEYKRLKAENKAYKQNVMNSALQSIGLEADKGIGKAVTKLYDGEMNSESIAQFVQEEFGEGVANVTNEPVQEPTVADNVVQAQSRVEQLNKVGVDNKPLDTMAEFKQFVNSSETSTKQSIAAKLAMMEQQDK
jgi:hypothetical protein|tara:strand:+ start:312 stop:770 length:459 start_codon:yes stop_codon:yes gene_type:complete